jgi:hypothetical protein
MNNKKQELGQFNTTRKDYILEGFAKYVRDYQDWVDPFAGNGDLLDWAKERAKSVAGYDVDPTKKKWTTQDTLATPPDYTDKWVIANPPYVALNKTKNKDLFKQHDQDDLYKVAIKTVCEGNAKGGIFIVPLNFLCSEQAKSIRELFFAKFRIEKCKAFEETVFDDTDYTVCAFYYKQREESTAVDNVEVEFLPSGDKIDFRISKHEGWILGEEFYKWLRGVKTKGVGRWTVENTFGSHDDSRDQKGILINDIPKKKARESATVRFMYSIKQGTSTIPKYIDVPVDKGVDSPDKTVRDAARLSLSEKADAIFQVKYPNVKWVNKTSTSKQYYKPEVEKNIIWMEAIDTGTKEGMIGLKDIRPLTSAVGHRPVVAGLPSSRNKAHIKFDNPPSIEDQEKIIEYVNKKLSYFREKYHSVFMTAFRNSTKECSRKRISFDVVYKMINKARQELEV